MSPRRFNPDAEGLSKAEGDRQRRISDEKARAKRNVDIERAALQRRREQEAAECNCDVALTLTDPSTHVCPKHGNDGP